MVSRNILVLVVLCKKNQVSTVCCTRSRVALRTRLANIWVGSRIRLNMGTCTIYMELHSGYDTYTQRFIFYFFVFIMIMNSSAPLTYSYIKMGIHVGQVSNLKAVSVWRAAATAPLTAWSRRANLWRWHRGCVCVHMPRLLPVPLHSAKVSLGSDYFITVSGI